MIFILDGVVNRLELSVKKRSYGIFSTRELLEKKSLFVCVFTREWTGGVRKFLVRIAQGG